MTEDRVPIRLEVVPGWLADEYGGEYYRREDVDALLASAQPAPPLDVERLTKVLAAHFGPSYFPGLTDVTIHGKTPEAIAEQIAAEYERLARND